jgi:vacuolar protein sorting-associated protein 13A/C
MDVMADGPAFVLKLTDWTPETSIFRRNTSTSRAKKNENFFEEVNMDAKVNTVATIRFVGIGLSMVDRKHEELLYLTLREVEFLFRDTNVYQTLGLTLNWIQIDNQVC